ncbi:MAG: hypothetical protein JW778_06395 [Candidatus Altiarchaeota archaeon]|nr:hypothetical protein [Candidatus Altiarchaeota archaeon]
MIDGDKLLEDLKALHKNDITLITVNAGDYLNTNLQTLEYLCNTLNLPGIYITVNRPYEPLSRLLQDHGINIDKLFFVDCVTLPVIGVPKRAERCLFISPADLTDIALSVDEWVASMPKNEKFLFMDSLSTLLFYNSAGSLARFSHFFTAKMRLWNLTGIFMSLEKENDPHFLDEITQFCDRIITIKEAKK